MHTVSPGQPGRVIARREVFMNYILTGSAYQAAQVANIKSDTARLWIDKAEASGELAEFREAYARAHLLRLTELRDLALNVMWDRLANGETIFDSKSGTLVKVPVGLPPATAAYKILADDVTAISSSSKPLTQSDNKLLAIAQELKEYIEAKSKATATPPPTDVSEFIEDSKSKGEEASPSSERPETSSQPTNVAPGGKT